MNVQKVPIKNKQKIFQILREADVLFVNNMPIVPIYSTENKIQLNSERQIMLDELDCILTFPDSDFTPRTLYLKDGRSVIAMKYENVALIDD
jgi:hypothetical protein